MPTPARLDQAGDARRRGGDQLLALAAELGLVVGHQAPPASIRRSARSDLPAPEGPRSSTARQARPDVLPLAQRHAGRRGRSIAHLRPSAAGTRTVKRAPSTRPSGRAAVGGRDRAAVGLHDLPADRQAEPRMLAEMLGRPLGVEALEDRFEIVLGNARALVVDGDDERPAARRAAELDHDACEPGGLNDSALSMTLRNTWP